MTMPASSVTGFVLAGGESRRMGRDKALLPLGRHTMIERMIEQIRLHVGRVMVIGHARYAAQRFPAHVDGMLTDLRPGHGPLMGVFTGLIMTETAINLFLPCDMPSVDPRLIKCLLAPCGPGAEVVASRHPVDGVQPFPLVCHVSACRRVGRLLDRGVRSLQSLLEEADARTITIADPQLWRSYTNVNTVAEYVNAGKEMS